MESRTALLALIREKDDIESQITALVDALPADVRVAKPNDLLDREGYPRADIDVHSVRVIRNQLARLQFDHVEKMKSIETALLDHHQSEPVARAAPQAPIPIVTSKPAQALQPFLVVTSVVEGSPAQRAGLKCGDHIAQFGSIVAQNWSTAALQEVTLNSENKPLTVDLIRNPEGRMSISLVPARWQGRGLLGCAIQPL